MKTFFRWLLAAGLVFAGVRHFVRPDFYVSIMPPYLPWHYELVLLSGACEILLGVLVVVPRVARPASWGVIALLAAVFPANVQMALHPDQYPDFPPAALYARLPLQVVFAAWAWWVGQSDPRPGLTPRANTFHPSGV